MYTVKTESKDLVSIIIPFYNAEKYLHHCLSCVKNQTYQNIEPIFVDDGSTDASAEIVREAQKKDARIKLISIPKSGVSAARNTGIENATGEYITFWDVDDHPHDDFVSVFVNDLRVHDVDIAICNYTKVYRSGQKIDVLLPWKNQCLKKQEIRSSLIPQMLFMKKSERKYKQREQSIWGSVWRVFTYTSFIRKTGTKFELGITMSEDLLFTLELYGKAENIYVEKSVLYDYVQNSGSTIRSAINKFRQNVLDENFVFAKKKEAVLKKLHLYESTKERYDLDKMCSYSMLITILARSDETFREKIDNLKFIRKHFIEEKFPDDLYSQLALKTRTGLYLLKHKMYVPLILVYSLKEKLHSLRLR